MAWALMRVVLPSWIINIPNQLLTLTHWHLLRKAYHEVLTSAAVTTTTLNLSRIRCKTMFFNLSGKTMKPKLMSTIILAAASMVRVMADPAVDKGKKKEISEWFIIFCHPSAFKCARLLRFISWKLSSYNWAELTLRPNEVHSWGRFSNLQVSAFRHSPKVIAFDSGKWNSRAREGVWGVLAVTQPDMSEFECKSHILHLHASWFETAPFLFSKMCANRSLCLLHFPPGRYGTRTLWHLSDRLRCAHRGCRY